MASYAAKTRVEEEADRVLAALRTLRTAPAPDTSNGLKAYASGLSRAIDASGPRESSLYLASRAGIGSGDAVFGGAGFATGGAAGVRDHALGSSYAQHVGLPTAPSLSAALGRAGQPSLSTGIPSTDELIDAAMAARDLADRSDPLMAPAGGPLTPAAPGGGSSLRVGAALLGRSGRVYTGCALMVTGTAAGADASGIPARTLSAGTPLRASADGSGTSATGGPVGSGLRDGVLPAEQVALLKALSEGEREFLAIVLASDSLGEWLQPTAQSARFLLSYGSFPVYLVRQDRALVCKDLTALAAGGPTALAAVGVGAAADGSTAPSWRSSGAAGASVTVAAATGSATGAGAMPSDGGAATAAATPAAGADASSAGGARTHEDVFPGVPVSAWGVAHVCSWLDRVVDLPQYQHRFREASVDGPLLLSLRDTDLNHLLAVSHPLHRRKIELGIARLAARDTCEHRGSAPAVPPAEAVTTTAGSTRRHPQLSAGLQAALQAVFDAHAELPAHSTSVTGSLLYRDGATSGARMHGSYLLPALAQVTGESPAALEPRVRTWVIASGRALTSGWVGGGPHTPAGFSGVDVDIAGGVASAGALGFLTFSDFVDAYLSVSTAGAASAASALHRELGSAEALLLPAAPGDGSSALDRLATRATSAIRDASTAAVQPPVDTSTPAATPSAAATGSRFPAPVEGRFATALKTQQWLREQASRHASAAAAATAAASGAVAATSTGSGARGVFGPTAGALSTPSSSTSAAAAGAASVATSAATAPGAVGSSSFRRPSLDLSVKELFPAPPLASGGVAPGAMTPLAAGGTDAAFARPPVPAVSAGSVSTPRGFGSVRGAPAPAVAMQGTTSTFGAATAIGGGRTSPGPVAASLGGGAVVAAPGAGVTGFAAGAPTPVMAVAATLTAAAAATAASVGVQPLGATVAGQQPRHVLQAVDMVPVIEASAGMHPDTQRLLHPAQVLRLFHVFMDAVTIAPSAASSALVEAGIGSSSDLTAGDTSFAFAASARGPTPGGGQFGGAIGPTTAVPMNEAAIAHSVQTHRAFLPQLQLAMRRLGYAGAVITTECRRVMMARGAPPAFTTPHALARSAHSARISTVLASTSATFARERADHDYTIGFADFCDFVAGVCQFGGACHGSALAAAAKAAQSAQAQLQVALLAQQQAAQLSALRMSLGLPHAFGAIGPAAAASADPTAALAGVAGGSSAGVSLRAVPIVDARGNVAFVSPLPAVAAGSLGPSGAAGALAASLPGVPPPMLPSPHASFAMQMQASGLGGAGVGSGIMGMPLVSGYHDAGLAAVASNVAAVTAGITPPVRDGAITLVVMHMVDGWMGCPGSDPWYTHGMDYDVYAVRVLRKESSIVEMVVDVAPPPPTVEAAPLPALPPVAPPIDDGDSSDDDAVVVDGVSLKRIAEDVPLAIGARVYARAKRSRRHQPGTVTGVRKRRNGTFLYDIEHDDGSDVRDVKPRYIRVKPESVRAAPPPVAAAPVEPPPPPAPAAPPSKWRIGDRVEARFSATLAFTCGRVTNVHYDVRSATHVYDVRYDGPAGLRDRGIPESDLRAIGSGGAATAASTASVAISSAGGAPTSNTAAARSAVTPDVSAASAPPAAFAVGDAVEARAGPSAAFSVGTCVKVHRLAGSVAYDVVLDVGGKLTQLPATDVRLPQPTTTISAAPIPAATLTPAAPVTAGAGASTAKPVLAHAASLPEADAGTYSSPPYEPIVAGGAAAAATAAVTASAASSSRSDEIPDETVPAAATASSAAATPAPATTPSAADASSSAVKPSADSSATAAVAASTSTATPAFAVGDEIEARYRGRGTKWYPGKIVCVTKATDGQTVFSIDYADGDKEADAKEANIRLVKAAASTGKAVPPAAPTAAAPVQAEDIPTVITEQASAAAGTVAATAASGSDAGSTGTKMEQTVAGGKPAPGAAATAPAAPTPASNAEDSTSITGRDLNGAVIGVGDSVEARYKGKGTRFYPGKIVAAKESPNGAVLFAINYDDGDTEAEARGEHIRLLKKAEPAKPADAPAKASEAPVPPTAPAEPAASAPAPAAPPPAATSASDTDASSAAATPASAPSGASSSSPVGLDEAGKQLGVGDVIEAKFRGRSKRYYKGVITSCDVQLDGTTVLFGIKYNDGDEETGAKGENIRLLTSLSKAAAGASASSQDLGASSTQKPLAVDVEASAGSSGPLSFKAVAASVMAVTKPPAASEVATSTTAAAVTVPAATVASPAPGVAAADVTGKDVAGAVIGVGDAIEARYKGKGTRWYKGKIAGAQENGSGIVVFAINYDDGDTEADARGENIKLLQKAEPTKPADALVKASEAPVPPAAADARAPAAAAATATPSTTSAPAAASPEPTNGVDQAGKTVTVGDRIEARFKGRGVRYYAGSIKAVKRAADGKGVVYAIAYDDGDAEDAALPENVRLVALGASLPSSSAMLAATSSGTTTAAAQTAAAAGTAPVAAPASAAAPSTAAGGSPIDSTGKPLTLGDRVEARYKGRGTRWYKGSISRVEMKPEGPVFSIMYDDGDKEDGALGINIKKLPGTGIGGLPMPTAAAAAAPATASTGAFQISDPKPQTGRQPLGDSLSSNKQPLGGTDSLNNTGGSLSSTGKLRVSFSDEHALDLERSHDDESHRYAPKKKHDSSGVSALSGISEASSSEDEEVEDAEYTDASFESLSNSGSGGGGGMTKTGEKSFAASFKPLNIGSSSTTPSGSSSGVSAAAGDKKKEWVLEVGAPVEALNPSFKWETAKVIRVAPDGGVSVAWDDGEFGFGLPQSKIRAPRS